MSGESSWKVQPGRSERKGKERIRGGFLLLETSRKVEQMSQALKYTLIEAFSSFLHGLPCRDALITY
jgi:hypothetical protein